MCALKSLHSINNVSENECNLITATWHLLVNTMQIHFNPFCFHGIKSKMAQYQWDSLFFVEF